MRTALSPNMLAASHAQETDEVFLPLVTMSQGAWTERIVPNTEPITHQSETYNPVGFAVGLPDEEAEGIPVLNWVADNVDRRFVQALRQVTGVVNAEISWVLADTPDVIEIGPMNVEMRGVQYDTLTISGTMGVEPILETPFGHKTMNPKNAPALF